MAEDAAERHHVFGVSPPTPTASSAGPSLAVQGNLASIDWNGVAPKKAALSGTSAGPPLPAISTSIAAAASGSSHHCKILCRPWDCGDFLQRLATFKLSHWNHKPQVVGPAVCARKGWVNVDIDVIACEACEAHLTFPAGPEVDAELFKEQLELAHKASCPWKGNYCAESLAQFLVSPLMALIGGYNDRCDALLQLHTIPSVSPFALDHMKLSRGPQIDRLLSQPPPIPGLNSRDRSGAESSSSNAFYKAQRLISICGWEARLLPHAADFEDHSAQSTRNACSVGPSRVSRKRGKRNTMVYSRAERDAENKTVHRRHAAASALLECNYCGANVHISGLSSINRPGIGPSAESGKKIQTLIRGISAASSIGGAQLEPALEGNRESDQQVVDGLRLVIAGGPLPTVAAPAAKPECSEMGDCGVTSYESRGGREEQQGTSSIYVPRLKAAVSESGTNIEQEGEEVDGKNFAAESSKRKRLIGESSGADQLSLGVSATAEGDAEVEVATDRKNKRVCIGPSAPVDRFLPNENSRRSRKPGVLIPVHENLRNIKKLTGDFPCSSSVNATDTCFQNRQENSMDSVEFLPQDDAQQHTAASGYTENEWLFDEPNSVAQAQHSESYAQARGGVRDEDTNAAVISTGTATAGGGSVGMPVSQRVQSNEADIQGADFSEHHTGSVAGEAEVVIDALENQGHSSDAGLVCDSAALQNAATQDVSDAVLSLCPGVGQTSGKDVGDESGESLKARTNVFIEEDRTIDTTQAVITGTSIAKEDGSVEAIAGDAAANSGATGTVKEAEVNDRQSGDFDPIRRHKSFCPWVNGLVLAAANGTFGSNMAFSGWQLTVDALDAFHLHGMTGATESESTASMCKGEQAQRTDGSSSPRQCNDSSTHWDPKK